MTETEIVSIVYSELIKVLGGVAVVLAALFAFLGNVWIDRIASRESQRREESLAELKSTFEKQNAEIKANLDVAVQRTVFVDKLQFEHEYAIYKQAWEALYLLLKATLQLRPTIDFFNPDESEEERMNGRMNAFVDPFNSYRDIIEKNKPFYSVSVYAALLNVCDRCSSERIDYEYTERLRKEYYEEARKNHKEIVEAIEAACEAIRNRISEVRVA